MSNDEGGGPAGDGPMFAERPRRADPNNRDYLSAAPMTHCLRINRRAMANSDEKRGPVALPSFVRFPSASFTLQFTAAIYTPRLSV